MGISQTRCRRDCWVVVGDTQSLVAPDNDSGTVGLVFTVVLTPFAFPWGDVLEAQSTHALYELVDKLHRESDVCMIDGQVRFAQVLIAAKGHDYRLHK